MNSEQTRDTVDTGYIRNEIIIELVNRGNVVREEMDYLIINNNAQISLSDSLIDLLVDKHLYTIKDFVDMIIQQYDYTMSNS